jgi:hypothetical protein
MSGWGRRLLRKGSESAGMATTQHQRDRHPPGYVPRSRQGKQRVSAYLGSELFAELHEVAAQENMTIQDVLERLCRDFVQRERVALPALPPVEDASRNLEALRTARKVLSQLERAAALVCDSGAAQPTGTNTPLSSHQPKQRGAAPS